MRCLRDIIRKVVYVLFLHVSSGTVVVMLNNNTTCGIWYVITVFFDVANQSYLPELVEGEQISDGNGKLQAVGQKGMGNIA